MIFHENYVLGAEFTAEFNSQRARFHKSRLMAKKLYTGNPCLSLREVLYVHSSTFNVSVYTPYYATWFVCHNEFAGKDGHRVPVQQSWKYHEK